MDDLRLADHRSLIEGLIARHIKARVEFVKSKEEIGGKLGRSLWNSPTKTPVIQFPELITAAEIDDSLLALAVRGQITENPMLGSHADEIESSVKYLEHLVLHEIAHIKHDWRQDRETDCDLWAYEQMHAET